MNNSGSPEDADQAQRPPFLLIALLIAFGLALIVGLNILRVLYGVIAPPLPPVPDRVTQISHESEAYGADIWSYTAVDDPCADATFYEAQGGTCEYTPLQCSEPGSAPFSELAQSTVARCHGNVAFSIFNMQWWALVLRNNDTPNTPTTINLEREVFWIGTGPRAATPAPSGSG